MQAEQTQDMPGSTSPAQRDNPPTNESRNAVDVLPDLPSALMKVAQADLRTCEADPRYRIDMQNWHGTEERAGQENDGTKEPQEPCPVCMAGSMMAMRLDAPEGARRTPEDYPYPLRRKLRAVNLLRGGHVRSALAILQTDYQGSVPQIEIGHYHVNPEGFHQRIGQLIEALESRGL